MATINDYLDFRGDLALAERPFNDVDNLILACLSYVDFSEVLDVRRGGVAELSMADACGALLERSAGDIAPYVRSLAQIDAGFLERLASSRRFGGALLHGYVDVIDEDRSLQFAALTADLDDGHSYVSFRGTDSTLVGWRENFVMSFQETGAQKSAARYLERACRRALDTGRKLLVGGHSKGGNLASFAAMKQPDALRPVIERVWSNDGPEMAPDVEPDSACDVLGDRYVKVMPTYSIVGTLFADLSRPYLVVKSSAAGASQHDPTTWQVCRDGFDRADDFAEDGKIAAEALRRWADGIGLADRERFTSEFFCALRAGGATTLDEVATPQSLPKVLSALGSADERTRQIVYDLAGSYVSTATSATIESVRATAREALGAVGGGLMR